MKRVVTRLLVLSPLYPPHAGGLENHADQFNKALAEAGYRITVLTPITSAGGEFKTQQHNLTVYRYPAWEVIPNYHIPRLWSGRFWRIFHLALLFQPDLILSRTRFFASSLLALALARLQRTPWLHIEHGSDYVYLNNPWHRLIARHYDRTIGGLVLRQADDVVAVSKAAAAFVENLSGRRCQAVIYRGLEYNAINNIVPDARTRLTFADKTIILYAGRLIDGKGLPDLIRAWQHCDHSQAILLIVGTGPRKEEVERLIAQRALRDTILLLGPKDWQATVSLMKTADIVVNPSYTEGLPSSLLEAAACAKAIIATDVGGTSEIITDKFSGLLFAPNDINHLAVLIDDLLAHPAKRRQLGQNARQQVLRKFKWATAVRQYEKIFQILTQ